MMQYFHGFCALRSETCGIEPMILGSDPTKPHSLKLATLGPGVLAAASES
jgi:hypothetical protein